MRRQLEETKLTKQELYMNEANAHKIKDRRYSAFERAEAIFLRANSTELAYEVGYKV